MSHEEIDARSIDEIPFAQDVPEEARGLLQARMREIFKRAGAAIAQDVIDLGCTGLVKALAHASQVAGFATWPDPTDVRSSQVDVAREVRSHMAGAGFGLPCYVPPTRYCLVHATIGGLQKGQIARHAESVNLCSRELTPEERKHAAAVQALIDQEGLKEAKEHFKVEELKDEACKAAANLSGMNQAQERPVVVLGSTFVCPEHEAMVWECRYCLAASIIQGPLQPEVFLELQNDRVSESQEIKRLKDVLAQSKFDTVTAFARVKRWERKLIET